MNNEEAYLSRKRIVLVDDEPGLLRMLETILTQAGFQNVLAFGGPGRCSRTARASAARPSLRTCSCSTS